MFTMIEVMVAIGAKIYIEAMTMLMNLPLEWFDLPCCRFKRVNIFVALFISARYCMTMSVGTIILKKVL